MGAPDEQPDCHKHAELKRKLYSAMQECDEGELSIAIPTESAVRVSTQAASNGTFSGSAWPLNVSNGSSLISRAAATPEPHTPGHPSQPTTEYTPIVVNIAYSLRNPVDGFEFVVPNDAYPYVSSAMAFGWIRDSCSPACSSRLHHAVVPGCCALLGPVFGQPMGKVYLGIRIRGTPLLGGEDAER